MAIFRYRIFIDVIADNEQDAHDRIDTAIDTISGLDLYFLPIGEQVIRATDLAKLYKKENEDKNGQA